MSELPEDVQRILSWPRQTRSEQEEHRLVEFRASVHREMRDIVEGAERFDRNLTSDEQSRFDWLQVQFDDLSAQVPSRKSTPIQEEVT